ncbi:MAG TPA: DUF6266 family protein [Pedobacter sp.]|uniref:DUF6266 family protein n=1 Tax=Pedobacter sp. TaxID=1411316 RepID=UPI002CD72276|nr:DUF6266 family protein [Pedobacter sp.]HMI02590.1 DUF6266 family protein [Pedobacter sp.]
MGFLKGGPFYHLVGKVGNNVGRVVNGQNVFSIAPAKGNRTPSAAQLVIQQKLTLMTGWLSEVSDFIRIGFEDRNSDMSAWNAAVRYNLLNAVTGVSPNFTIDYPKVLFSDGKLAKAKNMVLSTTEDAQLDFAWSAAIPSLKAGAGTDKPVLVVYNPSKQEWEVSVGAAIRSALSYDLLLPVDWSGDNVQVWTSFVSADNKMASTTEFVDATVVQ